MESKDKEIFNSEKNAGNEGRQENKNEKREINKQTVDEVMQEMESNNPQLSEEDVEAIRGPIDKAVADNPDDPTAILETIDKTNPGDGRIGLSLKRHLKLAVVALALTFLTGGIGANLAEKARHLVEKQATEQPVPDDENNENKKPAFDRFYETHHGDGGQEPEMSGDESEPETDDDSKSPEEEKSKKGRDDKAYLGLGVETPNSEPSLAKEIPIVTQNDMVEVDEKPRKKA